MDGPVHAPVARISQNDHNGAGKDPAFGYSKGQAFGAGILSGWWSRAEACCVPWSLAFAADAMLFIISDEIIPETHRGGYADLATFSLLGGFVLMMVLDSVI